MNKIDELIRNLCPDGVAYKHIWEVTAWDKKFNAVDNSKQQKTHKYTYLLASALRKLAVDGGDVKLLPTGGEAYGWTTEELAGKNISEGEIVAIPWGGKATVQYYKGKFVTADNRIATSLDKNYLDNKFLYYFMLSNLRIIQSFYRGSGIQHPSMAKVLDMKIPIPPLEVQKEIVNILDKFTQLEAELEAELEARRKQYEYYRNQLLTFSDEGGVRWTTLGEVAMYSKSRISSNELNHENYVGVDNLLQNRQGKANSNHVPTTGNMTRFDVDNILIGNIRPYLKKIWHANMTGGTNGDVLVIQLKDNYKTKLIPRYLYQLLASDKFFTFNMQNSKGAKMPRGDKASIMKFEIPVPSIEAQTHAVSILDKFDKLTHDISMGLPAEINARRQQYEHYRSKLLTFQEAAA